MDEIAKELKKKYVEELTGTIQSHHFVLFVCSAIIINSCLWGDVPLHEWLWLHTIGDLIGNNTNLLFSIVLGNLFLSMLFVFLIAIVYKYIAGGMFDLFSESHDINKYIHKLESTISGHAIGEDKALLETLLLRLKEPQAVFNRMAKRSELFCGFGALFLFNLNWIDAFVGLTFFACTIRGLYMMYLMYLKKIVPVQVRISILVGEKQNVKDYFINPVNFE
jgi:hypothetical protein